MHCTYGKATQVQPKSQAYKFLPNVTQAYHLESAYTLQTWVAFCWVLLHLVSLPYGLYPHDCVCGGGIDLSIPGIQPLLTGILRPTIGTEPWPCLGAIDSWPPANIETRTLGVN